LGENLGVFENTSRIRAWQQGLLADGQAYYAIKCIVEVEIPIEKPVVIDVMSYQRFSVGCSLAISISNDDEPQQLWQGKAI